VKALVQASEGAMLVAAHKPFLVGTHMSFAKLVMKCPMTVVIVIMSERRKRWQYGKGECGRQKCSLQLHDTSPNPERLTLRYAEPVTGRIGISVKWKLNQFWQERDFSWVILL
jgi:hypothetical protein